MCLCGAGIFRGIISCLSGVILVRSSLYSGPPLAKAGLIGASNYKFHGQVNTNNVDSKRQPGGEVALSVTRLLCRCRDESPGSKVTRSRRLVRTVEPYRERVHYFVTVFLVPIGGMKFLRLKVQRR